MKKIIHFIVAPLLILLVGAGCQKFDKPSMGDYPVDVNVPGGPLKFYAAFDGTTPDPLRNAVDSIKANFASDNPFTTTAGISGKGVAGVNKKYIKYTSFNDWASASSFTISLWFKKDGQTKNNAGGNGPEYFISLPAKKKSDNSDYHWSNAVGFLFIEGNNTACAVKSMFVSPSNPLDPNSGATDAWFTWEGGQMIAGLCDNNWHHLVLTYNGADSKVKLYIDGVQNPNVKDWGTHGALRLSSNYISEYRVGAGPSNNFDSDDWLACSLKGGLDQLRLYGTVLTDAEIQQLFAQKK
ncbi:MAG TPA: hypothetical protein PKA77_12055 [Chitinophagaceae bacterium]|jgi:hypothetical protein|nr:hypothetical protein [Chitinophagaceae bacterium]HMU58739.1 hypothetical protein [Chitinophagaceae bacterium]